MNEDGKTTNHEPYAIYFIDGDKDIVIPLSELSEEERSNGGYLLIEPDICSRWLSRHSDTIVFQVKGNVQSDACI